MATFKRHHEMDWLRIILVLAVFLHHIGMPFNGDGFLIMNTDSSKLLDDIMVYFEQFRLPLLFLIAGAGSTLFLSTKRWQEYLKQRSMRLLLPLIIAIVLIVPPQNYIANIQQFDSYLSAYPSLAMQLSTNHMWFIEYLVVFALLSVPIQHVLKSTLGQRLLKTIENLSAKPWGIFAFALLLMAIRVISKIYFPEDSGSKSLTNPSSSLFYGFFYLMGMVLMSTDALWQNLAKHRRFSLYLLAASSVIFYGTYFSPDLSPYLSLNVRWSIWRVVASLVAWSATLTILGYAQQYLTNNSPWLRKCNEMIYPFYIFHQTVIVVIGFYVIQWQTTIAIKILGLLAISLPLTVALCLVVYPFNPLRVMMGVKARKAL